MIFVIATGEQYSVREFIVRSGKELGMAIEWSGSGLDEVGIDTNTGKEIIKIDPRYFRPAEVETLLGDATKAKQKLGWEPQTTFLQNLFLKWSPVISNRHSASLFLKQS